MKYTIVHCQFCRSANSASNSNCVECGTKLLLVTFPASLQYDTNQTPTFYEDHLLERVTALEIKNEQFSEAVSDLVSIVREQSKMLGEQNQLIGRFYSILGLLDTAEARKLRDAWDQLTMPDSDAPDSAVDPELATVIAAHSGPDSEQLRSMLNEARRLFEAGSERQGGQMLERSRSLSPRNAELCLFAARCYYHADRIHSALQWVDSARVIDRENIGAIRFEALLAVETRQMERASQLAERLLEYPKVRFAGYLIHGLVSVLSSDWTAAAAAFKRCLAITKTPEIEYLIGCCYFEIGRFAMTVRHLSRSTMLDPDYADGWYMTSLASRLKGDVDSAFEILDRARAAEERNAQCREFLNGVRTPSAALPFRHIENRKTAAISGGARRIRDFVRAAVIGSESLENGQINETE